MANFFRTVATLVFLAFLYAGLAVVLPHLFGSGREAVVAAATPKGLLNGGVTAALDSQVVSALPRTPAIDGVMAGLTYLALNDAGPQVRAGCPGWLYIAEEITYQKGGARNLEARVRLAAKIRDLFAKRGLPLVVVPVPDKSMMVPDGLCGLAVAPQAKARFAAWREKSAALGLDQVDLVPDFPKDGFLRTDTHWNTDGARFAAGRIAAEITRRLGPGAQKVTLTESPPKPRVGDLMRLASLDRSYSWSGPAPDIQSEVSIEIARSGGLLDDVPAPTVVLAGSSFSRNSGFADFLAAAAAREVAQKSRDGGGFAGALLDILENTPQILDETRLVVWELPVRTLTQPLTEAERRFLGDNT